MIRACAAVFLLMAIWAPALHADTVQAASVSYEDVQAAVEQAASGDTVLVPEGEATWDKALGVDKGITLRGAGAEKTRISCGFPEVREPSLVSYTPAAPELNEPFRVTAFAFEGGAVTVGNRSTTHVIDRIRVDHNEFTGCPYYTVRFTGLVYGLVDHNRLIECKGCFRPLGRHDASWAFPRDLGGPGYMYIEDNYVGRCGIVAWSGWGARWVLRHNTVDHHSGFNVLDAHGNLPNSGRPDGIRGVVACEVYENAFLRHAPLSSGIRLHDIRGGTCIMFNNRVDPDGRVPTRAPGIWIREEDAHPRNILKDTYPGYDPVKDTYIWNNTVPTTGKSVPVGVEENSREMIKLGRDYRLERPDRSFYIPYPYPHPVRLMDVQEEEPGTVLLRHFDSADEYGTLVAGKYGPGRSLGARSMPLRLPLDGMDARRGVLSVWAKADDIAGEQTILSGRGADAGFRLVLAAGDGGTELAFGMREAMTDTWHSISAEAPTWQPKEWHHVAVYWDTGFDVLRLALDGRVVATGEMGFVPDFRMMRLSTGAGAEGGRGLRGALDELMVMNPTCGGALSVLAEP